MRRILLVIPSTTYRTSAFMQAAARLNAEVVVASDHRQAMASLVPDTTLSLNFRKPRDIRKKVIDLHGRKPIDAVVGVDDLSAYVAAEASAALGLPGNPPAGVLAARNKWLMRQKLSSAGVNVPSARCYPLKRKPEKIAADWRFPVVLKPIFLSASRGVIRADNPAEFVAAHRRISNLLSEDVVKSKAFDDEAAQILVEPYLPGVEVALEGMMIDGELKTLAIFDKPDPLEGPHFVETIYATPSRLPAYVQREVTHASQGAARALGIRGGPLHAELRINESGAAIIEVAARSIGGLCSQVLRFQDGVTLEDIILRQALGEDVSAIQRERRAGAVMMIPIPETGILRGVRGLEAARTVEGIESIIITIPDNQPVEPMPWGGRYLGFIFARGDLPEFAEASIREAHSCLRIEIEPDAERSPDE